MDITLHSGVLLIHVAGAVTWLGVVAAMEAVSSRVRARGDSEALIVLAGDYGWVSRALVLPGSLLVLLSGGWLMQDSGIELGEAWWLAAAIGLWIVAFLGSAMLRGPECTRITRLAAERDGSEDAEEEVLWRVRRVLLLARGELLVLVVALALMVLKPG